MAGRYVYEDTLFNTIYCCLSFGESVKVDDYKNNNVEPTEELLEAIWLMREARDKEYDDMVQSEREVELSEYELQNVFLN